MLVGIPYCIVNFFKKGVGEQERAHSVWLAPLKNFLDLPMSVEYKLCYSSTF